jgi:ubiquinone/menaquinone biosynthesis C-methylase UbiE
MTKPKAEMNRSTLHALSPSQSCRDRGRQSFIFHAKRQLGQFARSTLQDAFERSRASDGADSGDSKTSWSLHNYPAFAAWSALNIGSQQQMWRALGDMVTSQTVQLNAEAEAFGGSAAKGSLQLAPDLAMPGYFAETAYHGQPGGYCLDRGDGDWHAGALQEAGGTLYSRGAGTGAKDSKGQAVVRFISKTFPGFMPERVIDLGCGYGGQTGNYAVAFPEAEIHGIDLGAGLLRYAHPRAEALDLPIHFRQACASATGFPDASFDLVVSNILLHEIPKPMLEQVMRESFRLLKPGGLVVHQDVPTQRDDTPPFQQWLSSWQVAHNDEPFWQIFAETSVADALVLAGFPEGEVFEAYQPQVDGPLVWYIAGARKP